MSVWEALGELDRGQPRLGDQLVCTLREAIEQGRLAPGSRLPSTRDLAVDLGVSRGLVVGAYERLTAEGRLLARPGSGTVVAPRFAPPRGSDPPPGAPARSTVLATTARQAVLATAARPAVLATAAGDNAPLRPGLPDPGMFPRTGWRRAYERALTTAADADFGYGDPAGAFRLRAELAAYLARVRAARVDVERLIVTNGSGQAFGLVARVLRDAGVDRIGVEDPGSPGTRGCLSAHGVEPVGVPVDADGLDVAALERSGLRAVLVTPAHQYPTGVVLAPVRRARLLDWARGVDGLIVEDDYDAEFRYDRGPVGCLQGLAPEHVVLVGSVSRVLSPALRIGWLAAPRRWRDALRAARHAADLGGCTIEQLALAELLAAGGYDRHVRRVRRVYRERHEAMVAALRRWLPAGRVIGVAAGLHLTLELPPGADDVAVVRRAWAAGLGPQPLSPLRMPPDPASRPAVDDPAGGQPDAPAGGVPGLVLGFAAYSPPELTRAVRLLARARAG